VVRRDVSGLRRSRLRHQRRASVEGGRRDCIGACAAHAAVAGGRLGHAETRRGALRATAVAGGPLQPSGVTVPVQRQGGPL